MTRPSPILRSPPGYPDGGGTTRDPVAHVATLSGDVGTRGSATDNCYHIVTAIDADGTAVLAGFTITGGNAGGGGGGGGGGMFNAENSAPTVADCTFTGNSAGAGGGMYNAGARSLFGNGAAPTVSNCTFSGNSADRGGGMFNGGSAEWRNAGAAPVLSDCSFVGNTAVRGGGMFNDSAQGEQSAGAAPALTRCTFAGNSAGDAGGGMFNAGAGDRNYADGASATLTKCSFSGNSAGKGGGMYNEGGMGEGSAAASATLVDCTLSGNSAGDGGGMYNSGGRTWYTLMGDRASSGASPHLTNCTLTANSAGRGAGMYNAGDEGGASPALTNCTFSGNAAGEKGGGIFNGGAVGGRDPESLAASPILTNCTFVRNTADRGGGAYSAGGGYRGPGASPTFANCAFVGNTASIGGGTYSAGGEQDLSDGASVTMINCTFSANSAEIGGGMASSGGERGVSGGSSVSVTNCVFWGNSATTYDPQIAVDPDWGGTVVSHSIVEGGWGGGGNLSSDPLFVRNPSLTDPGNLRLRTGSPAIDAGNTAAVPSGVATDLAGLPRVTGAAVDIGAFEYQPVEGTSVYEAEQAALTGAVASEEHPGFTGSGFVDYLNRSNDAVEFTVDVPSAGRYALSFRFANGGSSARSMGLSVNGVAAPGGANFARTGSWATWNIFGVTVPLVAGSNKVRLFATGQSGPNLDSLAVRVAPVPPPQTYQAESAVLSGPLVASNVPGFTGAGFADYQHGSGDFAEFTIDAPADGAYALDFRYANGSSTDRALNLAVDGQVLTGRVSFAPTGAWKSWNTSSRPVTLTAGTHKVRLTAAGSNGPNLDALTVRPAPQPATLQAEDATLSGPVVASNVSGYTGTGFADYQHGSGDYVEFTYETPSAGDYLLAFTYANGSTADRPLQLKVNGSVAQPSLSFGPTGKWSTWDTATVTVRLSAGANKIRLTSIGQNGPNLDALIVTPATA